MTPVYRYRASLMRVIDGDTYELRIDLGFGVAVTIRVRLQGVDAPEITGPTRQRGLEAAYFAAAQFEKAQSIVVETHKLPDGKRDAKTFDRYVADIWLDGVSLRDTLRAAGHEA